MSKEEQSANYFETLESPISSQSTHSEVAVNNYANSTNTDASNEVLAITAVLALGASIVALSVQKKIKEKTGGVTLKEYFWASFAERHGFLAQPERGDESRAQQDSAN